MRSKLYFTVYLFLALCGSTTIQSWLFLKNIKNFVWFPKQYLLGFFILEKQLANIPDRGFLFLRNTLLLYPLSPYSRTERQTEKQIHSLRVGWRNFFPVVLLCQFSVLAENRFWFYTRFAWAGGTFFPFVLLFQFFVLAGNRFWFYILIMYLEYHTGVVVLC